MIALLSARARSSFLRSNVYRFVVSTLVLATPSLLSAQGVVFDTVALSGQPVPGAAPGTTFYSFDDPVLNDAGQTAFRADLVGPGLSLFNRTGIFSGSTSALTAVARHGDPVPGTAMVMSFSPSSSWAGIPFLNNAGQITFTAGLANPGQLFSTSSGLFAYAGGALEAVFLEGEAAPEVGPGANFSNIIGMGALALNDAGQIAFDTALTGPGVNSTNNYAAYLGNNDTLSLVVRRGETAPGVHPRGTIFDAHTGIALNDIGEFAFSSFLTGSGINNTNMYGVYSGTTDGLRLVARAGAAPPGVGPNVAFSSFDPIAINNASQIAFTADMVGAVGSYRRAMFLESAGTMSLVVREGDAVAGLLNDATFANIYSPVLNDAGQIAFSSGFVETDVDATYRVGIFIASDGEINLVASEGQTTSGADRGLVIQGISGPTVNSSGQVAFFASLSTEVGGEEVGHGVFATDPQGKVRLIVRDGQVIDVNPDPLVTDERTVEGLYFTNSLSHSGGSDGRRNSFNSAGQLVLSLRFTDGTRGVFIASMIIPEPTSLALLSLSCLSMLTRRRK